MDKVDYRRLPEIEQFVMRKIAISLIKSRKKKKDITQLLGVRPTPILEWVKKHKLNDSAGLKSKKRGVKSEDRKLLSDEQEKEVQKMIIDIMPDQLKLDYTLRTRRLLKN